MHEVMDGLFTSSKVLILDLQNIQAGTPDNENIRLFFEACQADGTDPRQPENRQRFNNNLLEQTGFRYLIGQQGEDRFSMLEGSQIAQEGRTVHLGVDIFCKSLEQVYAPCDGTVIRTGNEPQSRSYGNFLIFKPDNTEIPYMFFGHLSSDLPEPGAVKAGQPIAQLGNYSNNENGGWSRHLHLQMITDLPEDGKTPIGYSATSELSQNLEKFPSPFSYFPQWKVTKNL